MQGSCTGTVSPSHLFFLYHHLTGAQFGWPRSRREAQEGACPYQAVRIFCICCLEGKICSVKPFASALILALWSLASTHSRIIKEIPAWTLPQTFSFKEDWALGFESSSGDSNVHPGLLETTASMQGLPGLGIGLLLCALCAFPFLSGLCQSLSFPSAS